MIISIITGGSGSENIQTGLYNINNNIPLNLIINGYDDGKSTGVLRKIFKNTLGISDFRKNQILEYKLRHGNNNIYYLLNHRFTININSYNYIINLINTYCINNDILKIFLISNTIYFFDLIKEINFEDFSFMNIIYCSLLHKNNNDMIIVCNIIKNILNLKNNIFINSNDNLILNAITKNNNILNNEEAIVNFNDKNDKIVDVFFYNNNFPMLNKNTEQLLLNSDIIIASCGTQFSSLIPTYKTIGFKETLNKSTASKYLILNCNMDNDILNYNADELLDKINEYIILNDFNIIISDDYIKQLIPTKSIYSFINIPKLIINNKHNGFLVWKYILKHYFNSYFNNSYIFDYDYTIFDKNNYHISVDNIKLLQNITNNKIIITNNCFNNLLPINNITIYSNFANIINNKFIINNSFLLHYDDLYYIYNIINTIIFDNNILLNDIIIENRKNISIAIKYNFINFLFNIFNNFFFNHPYYNVVLTGKTTIEIIKIGLSKRNCFIHHNFLNYNYTYITDKNDIEFNRNTDNIKYLQVNNINTTNLFLNSIIINQKYDFCIIVAGTNSRFNIQFPKCLLNIYNLYDFNLNYDNYNNIILTKIIQNIIPFANNIFICCNNLYKQHFIKYQNIEKKYQNIFFLYFDSIDNTQNFPRGNAETIYQLLFTQKLTSKIFIMWGDILLSNNKIFEEMYNLQYDTDFLIPALYEKNPYAYLIINQSTNLVDYIEYYNHKHIDFGFHDQSIFLCNTQLLKQYIIYILNHNKETAFLDIVKYINNVKYYITDFPVKSFNTINEFLNLF
jgi:2-phospho-L-lactate transferase/gluconeogenesis factor (CofD/UPF0052 family)